MTYRITTPDGTAFIVDEVDLDVVKAYLVLRGYPPISIEVTSNLASPELDQRIHRKKR